MSFPKAQRRLTPPTSDAPSPGAYNPSLPETRIPPSFPHADRDIHERLDTDPPFYNPPVQGSNTALKFVQPKVHDHKGRHHDSSQGSSPGSISSRHRSPGRPKSTPNSTISVSETQNPLYDDEGYTEIQLQDVDDSSYSNSRYANIPDSSGSSSTQSSLGRRNPFASLKKRPNTMDLSSLPSDEMVWANTDSIPVDPYFEDNLDNRPKQPEIFTISKNVLANGGSNRATPEHDRWVEQDQRQRNLNTENYGTDNSSQQRDTDRNSYQGTGHRYINWDQPDEYVTPAPQPAPGMEVIGNQWQNRQSRSPVRPNSQNHFSEGSTGSLRSTPSPLQGEPPGEPKFVRVWSVPPKRWLSAEDLAIWGVICGGAAILFGILQLVVFHSLRCILAGLFAMFTGVFIFLIEIAILPKLRLTALSSLYVLTDLVNNRPYWMKTVLYLVIPIISIAVCATWASGVGGAFLMSLAVVYGIKQVDQIRKMKHLETNAYPDDPRLEQVVPANTSSGPF